MREFFARCVVSSTTVVFEMMQWYVFASDVAVCGSEGEEGGGCEESVRGQRKIEKGRKSEKEKEKEKEKHRRRRTATHRLSAQSLQQEP